MLIVVFPTRPSAGLIDQMIREGGQIQEEPRVRRHRGGQTTVGVIARAIAENPHLEFTVKNTPDLFPRWIIVRREEVLYAAKGNGTTSEYQFWTLTISSAIEQLNEIADSRFQITAFSFNETPETKNFGEVCQLLNVTL